MIIWMGFRFPFLSLFPKRENPESCFEPKGKGFLPFEKRGDGGDFRKSLFEIAKLIPARSPR
jgi:hypothetical protein